MTRSAKAAPVPAKKKQWFFRLFGVIAVPAIFFAVIEGTLRLAGIGHPTSFFIPDEQPGFYCTNPHFTQLFLPAHFDLKPPNFRLSQKKPAGATRIFVLGESAVFGTPEPGFGFVAQLRAQLRAAYPERKIEVYNLGITAINSHVVYRIACDLRSFNPDLLVIYLGNNEVIGPYGPASMSQTRIPSVSWVRASVWMRSLRSGQLLAGLIGRYSRAENQAPEWRGLRTFSQALVRGDDPRLESVYGNFEANLRAIVDHASSSGTKVVLSTVVANLKDNAPFASLHPTSLSEANLTAWQRLYDEGVRAWELRQTDKALDRFEAALKIDPQYADVHFLLGEIRERRGELPQARKHYVEALHWDAVRLRPDPRINAIIRGVGAAAGNSVRLLDAARELGAEEDSTAPVSGHELLFEHVHFNWEGNFHMAQMLARECGTVLFSAPPSGGTTLTADECAAAVGCTDYGQLGMLYGIANLTKVPPFTNQITFVRNQNFLKNETTRLETRLKSAGALRQAADRAAAAIARDPENPELPIRLEEIEVQLGNHDRGLQLIDQAAALQPPSPELTHKRANLLLLLKRFDEAETELTKARQLDPYFLPACQTLGEVWAQTAQFEKGRHSFDDWLQRFPRNHYLRLAYADLLLRSGDSTGAERECRRVLEEDPGDEGALERLGRLFAQTHRTDAALQLMLAAFRQQPKNHANNTRLAQIFDAKNDAVRAVEFMQATTKSGPTPAAFRARLAQRLLEAGRREEMMIELLQARDAAESEGNEALQRELTSLIRRYGADAN